jgi:lipopolysaccharide export LptBFGC system permease protein LptF
MLKLFRGRTLQRYILREFVVIFGLALAACTLLMILVTLYQMNSEYGQEVSRLALLFPFLLPKALGWSIPMATLIASTMVFSRLSAEDEILAAQAGGAPLRAMTIPILASGVFLASYCLWNNQGGLAWGNSMIRNQVLKLDKPEKFFDTLNQPGTSLSVPTDNGATAHINLLPLITDPKTHAVRRPIHIAYFQNQQVALTVIAEDFTYKLFTKNNENVLNLTLRGAQRLGESPAYFDEVTMEIPQPPLDSIIDIGKSRGQLGWLDNYADSVAIRKTYHDRYRFMLARGADFAASVVGGGFAEPATPFLDANSWSDTRIATEAIYATGGALDREHGDTVESWRKIAMSLLPMSMSMLGIGLGLLVKKSQRMVGLLSSLVIYALVYYPLMLVGKELAMAGKLGLIALWIPNIVMFAAGYALCFAYEHGSLSTGLPPIFTTIWEDLVHLGKMSWKPMQELSRVGRFFFQRKTDAYIAGAFIVPLLIVLLTISSVITAFDLAEHGGEVVQGIVKAGDPNPGVPVRLRSEAILDAITYYGISSLGWICDLLPAVILVAGIICVYALIRNNEHLIVKSAGLPLQRAFRPIIIITLVFSAAVTLVRETVLPQLIMHRDYLKAMVYHRTPSPNAIALYTTDAAKHPVIFEMSEYTSSTKSGKDLRIFLLDAQGKRIPSVVADLALWDGSGWKLQNDPNKALDAEKHKRNNNKTAQLPLIEHGYFIQPESTDDASAPAESHGDVSQVKNTKKPLATWQGTVTPALLESERLGPGVMRLSELNEASVIKSSFAVEWWFRVSEVMMGMLLLWTSIPLLLDESTGPLTGIGYSILVAAGYWALIILFTQGAKSFLPVWAPLIPHAIFLIVGRRRYYVTMPT